MSQLECYLLHISLQFCWVVNATHRRHYRSKELQNYRTIALKHYKTTFTFTEVLFSEYVIHLQYVSLVSFCTTSELSLLFFLPILTVRTNSAVGLKTQSLSWTRFVWIWNAITPTVANTRLHWPTVLSESSRRAMSPTQHRSDDRESMVMSCGQPFLTNTATHSHTTEPKITWTRLLTIASNFGFIKIAVTFRSKQKCVHTVGNYSSIACREQTTEGTERTECTQRENRCLKARLQLIGVAFNWEQLSTDLSTASELILW